MGNENKLSFQVKGIRRAEANEFGCFVNSNIFIRQFGSHCLPNLRFW